jgi:hypothetical protein
MVQHTRASGTAARSEIRRRYLDVKRVDREDPEAVA